MSEAMAAPQGARGVWSEDEHERFRSALELFPNGPWKAIAEYVGTRTVRQVQTHAQKYHERAARRLRQLCQHQERLTYPVAGVVEAEVQAICEVLHQQRVPLSPRAPTSELDPVAVRQGANQYTLTKKISERDRHEA